MDENSLEYWSRKRRAALKYKNSLMKKQFPEPFIPTKIRNLKLA